MDSIRECSIDGCVRASRARGCCEMHYRRLAARGTTETPRRSTVAERLAANTRRSEGCWEWLGAKTSAGYGHFQVDGRMVYAHRVAYELAIGPIPDGLVIDHKCYQKSCVNPSHLQAVTSKQNNENIPTLRRDNRSGMRGVSWSQREQRWRAEVGHNRQRISVGYFRSFDDACRAVVARRNALFTNNPSDRPDTTPHFEVIVTDLTHRSDAVDQLTKERLT